MPSVRLPPLSPGTFILPPVSGDVPLIRKKRPTAGSPAMSLPVLPSPHPPVQAELPTWALGPVLSHSYSTSLLSDDPSQGNKLFSTRSSQSFMNILQAPFKSPSINLIIPSRSLPPLSSLQPDFPKECPYQLFVFPHLTVFQEGCTQTTSDI